MNKIIDGKKINLQSGRQYQQIANKVSLLTILWNTILFIFKLFAGIVSHSNAMISDAVHSASDVLSTIVVIIGIKLSSKASDREHPYGHERMECVAAIILAMLLCITGCGIGLEAIMNIVNKNYNEMEIPGTLALIAAIISIITKEAMFWYTRFYARRIDSSALMADAWHHRSDALSSIGALVGILGAQIGFPVMDSVASLVIFLFIIKASYDIFQDAVVKMVDHACDNETEREIYRFILQNQYVHGIDLFHTRMFGNKIYVDVEITIDRTYSLDEAHKIARSIHDRIEIEFPRIKHITILVNPDDTHI